MSYALNWLIMIDYDSFSRCHLTDIFFRFSRGSKRVKGDLRHLIRKVSISSIAESKHHDFNNTKLLLVGCVLIAMKFNDQNR